MKIYVASSWKNNKQPEVVQILRRVGYEVYDFKNPEPYTGFDWAEIDPNWQNWSNDQYLQALNHPRAIKAFKSDFNAMKWADVCVLVLPCNRSAHTEAGWMSGMNKPTIALIDKNDPPELMYKIFDKITDNMDSVLCFLESLNLSAKIINAKVVQVEHPEASYGIFCYNETGDLFINSDWGFYAYSWRSFGNDSFENFLKKCNNEYIIGKLQITLGYQSIKFNQKQKQMISLLIDEFLAVLKNKSL